MKNGMRPVHPGEVLKEEFLVPLELSQAALARALHVSGPTISQIVREERGVTADVALRLAKAFDMSPEFWLNLQAAYDLRKAEIEKGEAIDEEVERIPALECA